MSAFVSVRFQDSIQLFADGAAYDSTGTVISFEDKIKVSKVAPVAVAVRGTVGSALKHAQILCDMADHEGVEELLKALTEYEDSLCARRLFKDVKETAFDFAIAMWLPNVGLKHYRLHSVPLPGFAPFKLHELGDLIACGAAFAPHILFEKGILPVTGDTTKWAKSKGVEIMEIMRSLQSEAPPGLPASYPYLIGGHVDLATITESGVKLRRVKRWPDKVGEKIVPFVQEEIGGNRRERRGSLKKHRRNAA